NVIFGGVPASFTFNATTQQITAVSPAEAAGPVNVYLLYQNQESRACAPAGLFTFTTSQGVKPASQLQDVSLSGAAFGINPTEETSWTGHLASFQDADLADQLQDVGASINWGDGTGLDPSTITGGSGGFLVSGTHTYAEAGSYLVSVTLETSDGRQWTVFSTATVKDQDLQASGGATLSAPAGQALPDGSILATFSDPAWASGTSGYQALIRWGDSATSGGTLVAQGNGSWAVEGSHTYALPGNYTAQVVLQDDSSLPVLTTTSVHVSPATPPDPRGLVVQVQAPANVKEGQPLDQVAVATMIDPNPAHPVGCHSATINWGDGTTSAGTLVVQGDGTLSVLGSHTYAKAGACALQVTGSGGSGETGTGVATVLVKEADLAVTFQPFNTAAGAGLNNVVLATFTDPNPLATGPYTAQVAWGDGGTLPALVVGSGNTRWVVGSHTYGQPGNFTAQVSVSDDGLPNYQAVAPVSVAEVAAGDGSALLTLATFRATGTPGDYLATIDWGDGTYPTHQGIGSIGLLPVKGSHAWAAEDLYQVQITAIDQNGGGGQASHTRSVVVGPASLSVQSAAPIVGMEGIPLTTEVGIVNDPSGSANDSYQVDWGDGSTSPGTPMDSDSAGLHIQGSHTYAEAGTYTVTLLATDADSRTFTAKTTAQISDADLSLQPLPVRVLVSQTPGQVQVATLTDQNLAATAADLTGTVSIDDGAPAPVTFQANGSGSFQVYANLAFAQAGTFALHLEVQDGGPPGMTANADSSATAEGTASASMQPLGGVRTTNPQQGFLLPVGEVNVALNTGGLRLSHPLDFDQSPGTS
ncbi:MAG: hypothetical protein JO112_07330, partial [Planctomycetes bacterium]|nr:hypothetical protein [Planctomycetota bacterium]